MLRRLAYLAAAVAALPTFPLWILPVGIWAFAHQVGAKIVIGRTKSVRRIRLLHPLVDTADIPKEVRLEWGVRLDALGSHVHAAQTVITAAAAVVGTIFIAEFSAHMQEISIAFPQARWIGLGAFFSLMYLLRESVVLSPWKNAALGFANGHTARAIGLTGITEGQRLYENATGRTPPDAHTTLAEYIEEEWSRSPESVYQHPGRTLEVILQRYLSTLLHNPRATAGTLNAPRAPKVSTMHGDRHWWEVLDVEPDVDREVANKAYRQNALMYHPDRVGDSAELEETLRKMGEVSEAWSVARKHHGWA